MAGHDTWLKQQARLLLPDIRNLSRTMQEIDEQRHRTRADTEARKDAIGRRGLGTSPVCRRLGGAWMTPP